jgi:Bacterial regulatory proteins, luxR family
MAIERQLYERQMELIFRMLLENKTNEQIASELKISIRSVQNYKRKLEKRYMAYQKEKTDSTLFLEVNLLKNRLLKLYRCLESKVTDPKTGPSDSARCADVAADIAIQIIKLESEGIRAVKELGLAEKAAAVAKKSNANFNNNSNNYDNDDIVEAGSNNNSRHNNNQQHREEQEEDNNRKF